MLKQLTYTTIKALPKIDLHRHLEGSLRVGTLSQIAREYGLSLPAVNTAQLRPLVQFTEEDPTNLEHFLAKFEVLRQFYQSDEAIQRLTYEAILDAATDNVQYLELRFSPQALARVRGFPLEEVTEWVIDATRRASRVVEIKVGLIITLLRHESVELAEQVAQIAFDRQDKGIIGIDLAGNEIRFPAGPFKHVFQEAHRRNMGITVHAGEAMGSESVRSAIEDLHAHRLGHGVRTADYDFLIEMVKERGIALEMCLISNVQTGAVATVKQHPIRKLMNAGVLVTLNTDDPSVSDSDLTNEYIAAVKDLNFSYEDFRQTTLNAAACAFLPEDERQALINHFTEQLPLQLPPQANLLPTL